MVARSNGNGRAVVGDKIGRSFGCPSHYLDWNNSYSVFLPIGLCFFLGFFFPERD